MSERIMYREETVEQGTEEWLKLRRSHIGASEAAIILGVSPWSTPYKAWLDKLGFGEPNKMNSAMKRGIDAEPLCREMFQALKGIEVQPKVLISTQYPWMIASLDGISSDGQTLLEIKNPGRDDHMCAVYGNVPEKYKPQLLHQMIVTGLKQCIYMSCVDQNVIMVDYFYNEEQAELLVTKEREFWACVENLTPPELTDKDYVERTDLDWKMWAGQLQDAIYQRKEAELREKQLKQRLVEMAGDNNARGGGVTVSKIVKKGNIDYSLIPELEDQDLEQYRKPSTQYWRVM